MLSAGRPIARWAGDTVLLSDAKFFRLVFHTKILITTVPDNEFGH